MAQGGEVAQEQVAPPHREIWVEDAWRTQVGSSSAGMLTSQIPSILRSFATAVSLTARLKVKTASPSKSSSKSLSTWISKARTLPTATSSNPACLTWTGLHYCSDLRIVSELTQKLFWSMLSWKVREGQLERTAFCTISDLRQMKEEMLSVIGGCLGSTRSHWPSRVRDVAAATKRRRRNKRIGLITAINHD